MKKYTMLEIQEKIKNKIELLEEYKNISTKIKAKCITCNQTFEVKLENLTKRKSTKTPCPFCNGKYISYQIAIETLKSKNLNPINAIEINGFRSNQHYQIQCQKCNNQFQIRGIEIKNRNLQCMSCAGLNPEEQNITKGIIYKCTAPDSLIYIGQTIRSLLVRAKCHKKDSANPNHPEYYTKFGRAIQKWGFNNLKWEIIHYDIPILLLDDLEKEEIKKHNSFLGGLNSTEGGNLKYENANAAIENFKKHIERKRIKEISARAVAQKRSMTNFEKNMKAELKHFMKRAEGPTETEMEHVRKTFIISNNAKRKSQALLQGIDKKSSQYRGVCLDRQHNKWKANIKHAGKKIHIGLFGDEIAAARAYDAKAKLLHGARAKLNFP